MQKIEVAKTISTPHMVIDAENNYLMLAGESFPENIMNFYGPLLSWLESYLATDFSVFTFDCRLVYFNSSTSKLLMNILGAMNSAAARGKNVIVNWHSSKENDVIIECGEEFGEDFGDMQFNIIIE